MAQNRLAVESAASAASAVAADRETVADARDVVITAKADVEQIMTDVHQTKSSIENTASIVDQTLEQYGTQFVAKRELVAAGGHGRDSSGKESRGRSRGHHRGCDN
ncbi:hypothetical protein R3Q06_27005 [Rhodococcus erythropolis]|uniref:hypothetical protein n=1 Tax=Rhodococcus erythropolis TaxID=1833 RepID=UPI002948DD43|nr:hypothetical protein [Rhodococcus erythropolis]MDV6277152.1 hypothetical protein [Rhodococcus erythropolis]